MDPARMKSLLSRARGGDKEAFALLYHELKKPVFTVAWRIVQSMETAQDITQDVFIKLFTSPPDSSVKNPRAWLFQVTRNLALDHLRKTRTQPLEEETLSGDGGISNAVRRLDVTAAMEKLTDLERQTVSLRIDGGLTFGEISAVMEKPLYTVYRTYRRAISALRQELGGM